MRLVLVWGMLAGCTGQSEAVRASLGGDGFTRGEQCSESGPVICTRFAECGIDVPGCEARLYAGCCADPWPWHVDVCGAPSITTRELLRVCLDDIAASDCDSIARGEEPPSCR